MTAQKPTLIGQEALRLDLLLVASVSDQAAHIPEAIFHIHGSKTVVKEPLCGNWSAFFEVYLWYY